MKMIKKLKNLEEIWDTLLTGQHAYSNTIWKEEENNIERIFEKMVTKVLRNLLKRMFYSKVGKKILQDENEENHTQTNQRQSVKPNTRRNRTWKPQQN